MIYNAIDCVNTFTFLSFHLDCFGTVDITFDLTINLDMVFFCFSFKY